MVKPGTLLVVGVAVAVPLVVVLSTRKKTAPPTLDPESPEDDDPGESDGMPHSPTHTIAKPLVVGPPSSALVAPYIALLIKEFQEHGADTSLVVPMITMTKAPKQQGQRPVAVPPQNMWAGLATVAGIVTIVKSQSLQGVSTRTTGYRPQDYNAAVGGAAKSRHIFGDAADVWLNDPNEENREKLRMGFARYIVSHSKSSGLGFGFGVYTNDIHIDVGRKAGQIVTWKQGKKFIDKAKAELGIA